MPNSTDKSENLDDFFREKENASTQATGGRGAEGKGDRILSKLQAQLRAPSSAWSHDPEMMKWAETKCWTPNPLSHPVAWNWNDFYKKILIPKLIPEEIENQGILITGYIQRYIQSCKKLFHLKVPSSYVISFLKIAIKSTFSFMYPYTLYISLL